MHRAERIHAADGEGMLSRQKALMGHPEMSDAQFCNRFLPTVDCYSTLLVRRREFPR
jgi:hypothetical protein